MRFGRRTRLLTGLGAVLAGCALVGLASCGRPPAPTPPAPTPPAPTPPAPRPQELPASGSPSPAVVPTVPATRPISSPPSPVPVRPTPAPHTAVRPTPAPPTAVRSVPARPTPPAPGAASLWRPVPGTPWQWQLTTPVDQSVDAPVYDIDLFENPASVVTALHAAGRKVICYLSAGSWEPYRPDAAAFPPSVLGAPLEGWEDERWLDIRRLDVLEPIMAARLDLCRSKGFDAVEPDNVDGYAAETGFPLTAAHQLGYNRRIAALAHERGLAVGLKNDLDQVPDLVGSFDFAVNESCARYRECAVLRPFVQAGKAVFHAEYGLSPAQFCPVTVPMGLSSIRKRTSLDAYRQPC